MLLHYRLLSWEKKQKNKIKRWFRIQYYGIVDVGQTIPVHNYFGFKMRWQPLSVHHFWWGWLLMAPASHWTRSDDLLVYCVAYAVFCLGGYITLDDVYQHHRNVKHPEYHSPIHNFYGKYIYNGTGWMAKAIRKLNDWADGR
jgi:hypothetical protein